eukprot:363749-Chlamydomonas_euryale.AAC.3
MRERERERESKRERLTHVHSRLAVTAGNDGKALQAALSECGGRTRSKARARRTEQTPGPLKPQHRDGVGRPHQRVLQHPAVVTPPNDIRLRHQQPPVAPLRREAAATAAAQRCAVVDRR